jgi:cobalamin biosynthesis protein CobD/CbiB
MAHPTHPTQTHHHLAKALHPTPAIIKREMAKVTGFNAKLAVFVTRMVGTMWCAYLFTGIALLGLQTALHPGGEGIISWIAQTLLQLVLLSVIMVGQTVQSMAADARSENTFKDTEAILDRLDVKTQGGISDILVAIQALPGATPAKPKSRAKAVPK